MNNIKIAFLFPLLKTLKNIGKYRVTEKTELACAHIAWVTSHLYPPLFWGLVVGGGGVDGGVVLAVGAKAGYTWIPPT